MPIDFDKAQANELDAIVELLADDELGRQREAADCQSNPKLKAHIRTLFDHIDNDPNNELLVARSDQQVVAVLQMTYIPSLTYQGSWRGQIEGVRVKSSFRGQGLGTQFFRWAIERAKQRGCRIIQLTTDKQRSEAMRFYSNLGFEATHHGFKLHCNRD